MRTTTDKTTTHKQKKKRKVSPFHWGTIPHRHLDNPYIYEVWHFQQRSKELFSPYIKTFKRLKQQASGWPSECYNDEKKKNYLHTYKEHESIDLDPNQIEKNPGLRSLAKLMLNLSGESSDNAPTKPKSPHGQNPANSFKSSQTTGKWFIESKLSINIW